MLYTLKAPRKLGANNMRIAAFNSEGAEVEFLLKFEVVHQALEFLKDVSIVALGFVVAGVLCSYLLFPH